MVRSSSSPIGEQAGHVEGVAADLTDAGRRDVVVGTAGEHRVGVLLIDGYDGARHRLAEQRDERVAFGQRDARADAGRERHLDQALREAAVAHVVGGAQQPVAGGRLEHVRQPHLGGEVGLRRKAAEVTVHDVRPLRAAELVAGLAEQQQDLAVAGRHRRAPGDVVDDPEHADDRCRVDGRVGGLVVEADVAAGDGHAHLEAGVGEAAGRLGELPHHVGVLG